MRPDRRSSWRATSRSWRTTTIAPRCSAARVGGTIRSPTCCAGLPAASSTRTARKAARGIAPCASGWPSRRRRPSRARCRYRSAAGRRPDVESALAREAERRTFESACRLGQQSAARVLERVVAELESGDLLRALPALSDLAPVVVALSPYVAAFRFQHKDEALHRAVAEQLPGAGQLCEKSGRVAWATDTLHDVNGVARTVELRREPRARTRIGPDRPRLRGGRAARRLRLRELRADLGDADSALRGAQPAGASRRGAHRALRARKLRTDPRFDAGPDGARGGRRRKAARRPAGRDLPHRLPALRRSAHRSEQARQAGPLVRALVLSPDGRGLCLGLGVPRGARHPGDRARPAARVAARRRSPASSRRRGAFPDSSIAGFRAMRRCCSTSVA